MVKMQRSSTRRAAGFGCVSGRLCHRTEYSSSLPFGCSTGRNVLGQPRDRCMSYAVCAGDAPLESLEIVPMSDRIRFEHPIDARPADAELLGDRSGSRGPAHSSDARVPRLSKPAGLVDPGSGRDDHLRRGVRCATGVRGAHCIKFSTRTDQRVL